MACPNCSIKPGDPLLLHRRERRFRAALGSSDRSLADFFQIAMDPSHLVNITYADNHAGPSVSYFTRQKKAAAGISTKGKCAGIAHEAGGNGHQNGNMAARPRSASIMTIPTNQLAAHPTAILVPELYFRPRRSRP